MLQAILEGILLGLILAAFVGPVFFLLIQTSINAGIKAAMQLQAGIILSDAFCILLAYSGLAQFINDPDVEKYLGLGGGLVLIVFGAAPFFFKIKKEDLASEISQTKVHNLIIKGFLLNSSNPSVFIFWVGAITISNTNYGGDGALISAYFISTLSTVFFTDTLKALTARSLKGILTEGILDKINKLASAGLMIFGLILLYKYASNEIF